MYLIKMQTFEKVTSGTKTSFLITNSKIKSYLKPN